MLGFVGGALLALGTLSALVFCVERLVVAPEEKPTRRWPYLALLLGKFPAAAVLALVLVVVFRASLAGLAAGYGMALVGFFIERHLAESDRPPHVAEPHENE